MSSSFGSCALVCSCLRCAACHRRRIIDSHLTSLSDVSHLAHHRYGLRAGVSQRVEIVAVERFCDPNRVEDL